MNDEAYRYLKWADDIVALIHRDLSVSFTQPNYNRTVSLYTHGSASWSANEFLDFLSERIMSSNRRDIEKLLFRCGLSEYDTFKIADATHAVHPKDELWMATHSKDRLEDATTDVFESVFLHRIDAEGDSINTPEGFNVKRYAAFRGRYGIVKQRINPLTTDVESEIAVYLLAREMEIPCCPAYRFDENSVFSEFVYDFTEEYLVHMRRLFDGPRGQNELDNLLTARPDFSEDFYRMVLLDFVTRQDDRHLSNMALKVSGEKESFYPLYDNGRSLFFEDVEATVRAAVSDPIAHATTFGFVGTYWDHLQDIAARGVNIQTLANLNVPERTVESILEQAGFTDYRLIGARDWIMRTLTLAKEL